MSSVYNTYVPIYQPSVITGRAKSRLKSTHQPAWRPLGRPALSNSSPWHLDWPFLPASLVFGYLTWLLLHQVHPEQIRNLPLTDSYGPFILGLFLSCYFFIRFVSRSHTMSLILSLWLIIPIVLKLQQVILDLPTLFSICGFFLILIVGFQIIQKSKQ